MSGTHLHPGTTGDAGRGRDTQRRRSSHHSCPKGSVRMEEEHPLPRPVPLGGPQASSCPQVSVAPTSRTPSTLGPTGRTDTAPLGQVGLFVRVGPDTSRVPALRLLLHFPQKLEVLSHQSRGYSRGTCDVPGAGHPAGCTEGCRTRPSLVEFTGGPTQRETTHTHRQRKHAEQCVGRRNKGPRRGSNSGPDSLRGQAAPAGTGREGLLPPRPWPACRRGPSSAHRHIGPVPILPSMRHRPASQCPPFIRMLS